MQDVQLDPMSGFLDRFSCLRVASDMVDQAVEDGQPLAILWIDLDRFKQVNESFGYKGGDNIISVVADRLREIINDHGIIGGTQRRCLAS